MTGPNSSDGIEESEKPKKSDADLYNELINGFASSHILWGSLSEADKNQLIKDIMTTTPIVGTNIETQLQRYIAWKDEFTGLDLSKINIFQLRNKVSWAFFVQKNTEKKIKQQILKDYQITPAQYETQLATAVSGLGEIQLRNILKSDQDRENLVRDTLWVIPEKKDQISIITTISERESANRINRLAEPDKHEVKVTLDKAHFDNKLDETDIKILIDSGYLNISETKELVQNFIPYVTLEKAVELWLITNVAAAAKRNVLIWEMASEAWVTLDAPTATEVQSSLSLSEVLVSTDDFNPSDADYQNIATNIWFKNFAEDLAKKNKLIHEQLRNSGPVSLDSLREWILGLNSPHLEWFEKFREGSILAFSSSKDRLISQRIVGLKKWTTIHFLKI